MDRPTLWKLQCRKVVYSAQKFSRDSTAPLKLQWSKVLYCPLKFGFGRTTIGEQYRTFDTHFWLPEPRIWGQRNVLEAPVHQKAALPSILALAEKHL